MYDVITVGSATVDAFVFTDKKYFVKQEYCFPVGAKILIKELKFFTGGGGTNAAVSLARQGFKVAFLGKIGKGTNSERIIKELKKEGVSTELIVRENARTGFSVILDVKGKDRTILTFKGSNDDLSFDEINKRKLKTKWFYFSSMLGKSLKMQLKLADFARKKGIRLIYNPSEYLIKSNKKDVEKIIASSDITVMNGREARLLTGKKDLRKALDAILALGSKIAVITLGKKGAIATEGIKYYKVKARKIKPLDATGAGDAFASTFLACIMKNKPIDKALEIARDNAESVIKHIGAKTGLLRLR